MKPTLFDRRSLRNVLNGIKKDLDVSDKELAALLNVPVNRLKNLNVNPEICSRIGSLQEVIDRGKKVLGLNVFRKWIRSKPIIFGGRTPLDYLAAQRGYLKNIKRVMHSLSVINGDSCA